MSDTQLSHDYFNAELVIGLVSPVGAENPIVIRMLTETLNQAGYKVELIKVSKDVIPNLVEIEPWNNKKFSRYRNLMNAGNQGREKSNDAAILAKGAAFVISSFRAKHHGNENPRDEELVNESGKSQSDQSGQSLQKTAFIIDSLKRPEEVNVLRIIYPTGFLLVGIHEEKNRRIEYLTQNGAMSTEKAETLVEYDRDETGNSFGQRVNETFHLADCFLELVGNIDRLRGDVNRLIGLCFGNPFITPTFDEFAMFQAFASALRSADLSRQVGAVIANQKQLLATGANDCPSGGGGLYWPERDEVSGCISDQPDGRDYVRQNGKEVGCDSNRIEQLQILKSLAKRLSPEVKLTEQKIIELLDAEEIQGLTEYGRVVHAEMDALLACARQGISTRGADLYSTTFPCHNCAKHIIAAGISRVVYVEPYSKSKALDFHSESILTAGQPVVDRERRVLFEPFVGIGPRRFFEFFSMKLGSSYDLKRKIKETGAKKTWSLGDARLRLQMKPVSYLHFEKLAANEFGAKMPTPTSEKME